MTWRNVDTSDESESPKQGQIKFETREALVEYMTKQQSHLVVKRQMRKLVLIDTFKSIEEARRCASNTDYIIWVCKDL